MNMLSTHFPESLGIADLGCSFGPNTFLALITIIEVVCTTYQQVSVPMLELRLYLNDLPGNDFNSVSGSCFVTAVGSSLYCTSFPSNSLHFVHSSYRLHWLSQVSNSPASVTHAFLRQFQNDFSRFLEFRSQEVVRDLVLIFLDRRPKQAADKEGGHLWTPMSQAIKNLVSQCVDAGICRRGEAAFFSFAILGSSAEEVEEELKKEGSFTISRFEQKRIAPLEANKNGKRLSIDVASSLIKYQFGVDIMDLLFEEYSEIIKSDIDEGKRN
ncbi:hypothetical protein AMTRI_Chr09g20730 [Amborella trichopoda]